MFYQKVDAGMTPNNLKKLAFLQIFPVAFF